MKQLIEDYKRRLKTVKEEINSIFGNHTDSTANLRKLERLTTKMFEYKLFIADLERLERNVQDDNVQPDQTPKLVSLIDFTTLRTQKKTLIELIDDMEKKNAEYYKDVVSDLCGILNLVDCIQDFAVDVMGLNPIDVYDFELEENREDVVKPENDIKIKNLFITTSDDETEPVYDIIERKKQGIDCTEAESAEIKGYLRELKLPEEQQIVSVIQLLFPIEYGEFLDEV
jgi:hypothetical protein